MVSELGIFGWALLAAMRRKRWGKGVKIYEQEQEEGWLLRTKGTDSDEEVLQLGPRYWTLCSLSMLNNEMKFRQAAKETLDNNTTMIHLTRQDVNCCENCDSLGNSVSRFGLERSELIDHHQNV